LLTLPSNSKKYIIVISIGFFSLILLYVGLQSMNDSVYQTFSFTNGTSTWPAKAIRLFAIIIAFSFFFIIIQQLKDSIQEIKKKYFHPTPPTETNKESFWSLLFIDQWGKNKKENSIYVIDLWNHYCEARKPKFCILRVVFIMFFLFFLCIASIINIGYFDMPNIPARGKTGFDTNNVILYLAVALYIVLIFFIADITHLSNHFIWLLRENKMVIWPEKILQDYCYDYGLSRNEARYKLHMDLVSQLTGAVNTFIYYPFIILFLLILSRSHYFDNWHYTPLLFILIGFTVIIALVSAIRLRKGALDTRIYILEKLDEMSWYALTKDNQSQNKLSSVRLEKLIYEIKNLQTGLFLPLLQQPIVHSVFISFSGVGGLHLIDYLASMN